METVQLKAINGYGVMLRCKKPITIQLSKRPGRGWLASYRKLRISDFCPTKEGAIVEIQKSIVALWNAFVRQSNQPLAKSASNLRNQLIKTFEKLPAIVRKVKVWQSKDGWRWSLIARNGKILATSEAYSSKGKCLQTGRLIADQLFDSLQTTYE